MTITPTSASSTTPIDRGTIPTMARRRTYTAEQQQHALDLYLAVGASEAARQTGIPTGTIANWASRGELATTRAEQQRAHVDAVKLTWEARRCDLAHRIGEVAELALDRTLHALDGEHLVIAAVDSKGEPYDRIPNPADAKNLATTMAILVDKAQLLTGGATARSEHATVAQVRGKLDELSIRRKQHAA